jgi:hypothetical protein
LIPTNPKRVSNGNALARKTNLTADGEGDLLSPLVRRLPSPHANLPTIWHDTIVIRADGVKLVVHERRRLRRSDRTTKQLILPTAVGIRENRALHAKEGFGNGGALNDQILV